MGIYTTGMNQDSTMIQCRGMKAVLLPCQSNGRKRKRIEVQITKERTNEEKATSLGPVERGAMTVERSGHKSL